MISVPRQSKAPDPLIYDRFMEGIDKTALTLRSLHLFREFWRRQRADRDLQGEAKAANAKARDSVRSQLAELCNQWGKYPEEAAMWKMTYRYGEPDVYRTSAFPNWWPRGRRRAGEALEDKAESPRVAETASGGDLAERRLLRLAEKRLGALHASPAEKVMGRTT